VKAGSIIDRYILREMLPPFAVTLFFFSFIFLMTNLLEITNLIINYRIRISTVLWMLIYSMPFFLEFIIPMSVMMAVLLTFLRMSGDNEIVALKSGGVSLYRLLPPVAIFCIAGFSLTLFMSIYALPWGKSSFKKTIVDIAATSFDIGLKERTFNDSFQGVMLYINRVDLKNKLLIDVFIEDEREAGIVSTIVAPRGKIFKSPGQLAGRLRLYNGTIHNVDFKGRAVHSIRFDIYDFNLDLKHTMAAVRQGPKDKEEMSLGELRQFLESTPRKDARYYSALIEFHEKFSIPFACLALGLLAVPLGLQPMAGRRSFGLVLGLFFFLLYYLMLIVGWSFGESGAYPPAVGMWVPNFIMAGIGLSLLVRTARERPLRIDSFFIFLQWMKNRRLKRRHGM
jgi:lipopolysaccharide export system permease protein